MNIAVILAGGTGSRMESGIPKQYLEVNGKPIINYCLETFAVHPMVDGIQIVADDLWHNHIRRQMEGKPVEAKWKGFSKPGKNRQMSVYHALKDIGLYAGEEDFVIIHDAVRPLLTCEFLTRCLKAATGHDGVLPVLQMKDTVYFSEDGMRVSSLLKREAVFAGQAPEIFRYGKYYAANQALLPEHILQINGSTEPAVLAGMDIMMVAGDERNFKITTREDLERMRHIAANQK